MIQSAVQKSFPFSDKNFEQISRLAANDFGIELKINKKALVYSRLVNRLRKLRLANFSEYCSILEAPDSEKERTNMLASLTTNVTRFFREDQHFDLLKSDVLPGAIRRAKTGAPIRIWSAGCSTGQEPYSIAMTILGFAPEAKSLDVKVLATDVDKTVLESASRGIYLEEDLPKSDDGGATEGFEKQDDGSWSIKSEIRDMVAYRHLNLMESWPMQLPFEVIFCRNVAIYFNEQTRSRLWQRFSDALVPSGHLCIGHSERVSGSALEALEPIGKTSYKKRTPTDQRDWMPKNES